MKIALVFFCAVKDGGPDPEGKRRLDKAMALMSHRQADRVVISGGGRETGPLGTIYRDYLIAHGASESQIHLEGSSSSTISNLRNSQAYLSSFAQENVDEVLLIADTLQLIRISRTIRRINWPWKTKKMTTGICWGRQLLLEPIKMIMTVIDPEERCLPTKFFKTLRAKKLLR